MLVEKPITETVAESKAIADHYAAYIAALTQKYPERGL